MELEIKRNGVSREKNKNSLNRAWEHQQPLRQKDRRIKTERTTNRSVREIQSRLD